MTPKHLIVLALTLIVGLSLGATIFPPKYLAPKPTVSNTPIPTPTSPVIPLWLSGQSSVSPDGQQGIHFAVTKASANFKIAITVLSRWSNSESYQLRTLEKTLSNQTVQDLNKFYEQDPRGRKNFPKLLASWSPDSQLVAVYTPDEITLIQPKNSKHDKSFTINSVSQIVWGAESKLFILKNDETLWSLDASTDEIAKTPTSEPIRSLSSAYPRKGVAYSKYLSPNQDTVLVLNDGKSEKIYDLFQNIDGIGNIIFSPSGNKACIDYSVSGFAGYAVFDLTNQKKLADGGQYSHCTSWVDENRLLVNENSYWLQDSPTISILNLITHTTQTFGKNVLQ